MLGADFGPIPSQEQELRKFNVPNSIPGVSHEGYQRCVEQGRTSQEPPPFSGARHCPQELLKKNKKKRGGGEEINPALPSLEGKHVSLDGGRR